MNANHGNPVNEAEMQTLRERILKINEMMSWKQIQDESGLKVSTLSSWANEKYAGDNQNVALKVRQYLDSRDARSEIRNKAPKAPSFVETVTAKMILRRVNYAHALEDLAMIAGGPGIGKTASFIQYRDTKPRVNMITASPSLSGVQPILRTIVKSLRIEEGRGTPQALSDAISDSLMGTDTLLIIDEAQHLSDKAIEELRSIHDRTECAMVLGGNEDLYARFAGTSNRNVHAQVKSRIGSKVTIYKPSEEDVRVLAGAWGITDEATLAPLQQIAATAGALRLMTKVLRLAFMLLDPEKGEDMVSSQHVRLAWSQLSISAGGGA